MRALTDLLHSAATTNRLLAQNERSDRVELALTYLRLNMNGFLRTRGTRPPYFEENVLGKKMRFFFYRTFTLLLEEIFINEHYRTPGSAKVIIDCGSNIGMSVLYFKTRFPDARVIAFEPDETTFATLKHNVESNGLAGVELHKKAVTDRDGTIDFFYDSDDKGSLMASADNRRMSKASVRVESVALSPFIREEVDILKLDVEGSENKVLAELSRAGKLPLIRQMVIEYHHHIDPNEDQLAMMLSTLEANGFGYQISSEDAPTGAGKYQDIKIYAYRKADAATARRAAAPRIEARGS